MRDADIRGENEERDYPSITPSLLFTEEEVKAIDWEAVFAEW